MQREFDVAAFPLDLRPEQTAVPVVRQARCGQIVFGPVVVTPLETGRGRRHAGQFPQCPGHEWRLADLVGQLDCFRIRLDIEQIGEHDPGVSRVPRVIGQTIDQEFPGQIASLVIGVELCQQQAAFPGGRIPRQAQPKIMEAGGGIAGVKLGQRFCDERPALGGLEMGPPGGQQNIAQGDRGMPLLVFDPEEQREAATHIQ